MTTLTTKTMSNGLNGQKSKKYLNMLTGFSCAVIKKSI